MTPGCIRGARSYPPPVSCPYTTTIMLAQPAAPLDPRVRRLRAGEARIVECENRSEARFQLQGRGFAQTSQSQYYHHPRAPAQSLRPRRFQEVVVSAPDDGDDAMDEDVPVSLSRAVSRDVQGGDDDAEMSECPSPGESEDPLTPVSSSSGSPQSTSMELDAPANSYFGVNANVALPRLSRAPALFPTSRVCSKRKMDVCDADDAFAAQPPAKRVTVSRANMHPFALPTPSRNHAGLYVATTAAVSYAQ